MDRPKQPLPIDAIVTSDADRSWQGNAVSTLISLCAHLAFLLLLAVFVFPSLVKNAKVQIDMGFAASDSFDLESIDLESIEIADPGEIEIDADDEMPVELPGLFESAEIDVSIESEDDAAEPIASEATDATAVSIEEPSFTVDSLGTSASVEGAVDRITSELRSRLEKDDLLVIWLLDSSHSLVDDRKRVAARLTPFYENLVAEKSSHSHVLRSTVVAYGSNMRERVAPTTMGQRIVNAVEKLPIDRTGAERVFDAVARSAEQYRRSWEKQISIVIWTDESGDDTQYLSKAIDVCRDQQVSVSVVGPSSVLGGGRGLHSYTDPKSRGVYQLPVQRGPDSARPERLELGYWYVTRGGFGGRGFGRGGGLPSWMGGQDLTGILSGFSPYALTLLAAQTGGSYTIFDRPEDRGPFDAAVMKAYAPRYLSLEKYDTEIQANPIRAAVMRAVSELEGKKVDAPTMMFFTKKTGERHFDFMRYFYAPAEFQNKFRSSRGRLKGQATRYSKVIDKALRHLSADDSLETGLDDALQSETSPRWRAWYDLTRGRLLANSARLEEYRLAIDELTEPGALGVGTNHIVLVPNQQTRGDSKYQRRAQEAEQLLRRCVREHRGTPWAILAQRELDFAIGISAQQQSLRPTGGGGSMTRQPNLPRF